MKHPRIAVCYYPEHWPEREWASDARRMADSGIAEARIGEFAWSRIEPEPGHFEFEWLDRAIATLRNAGISVMLGTPTATPPKWLIDKRPDILAYDRNGRPRNFGSRRHYCFSSRAYREECARIVTLLADRYGRMDGVTAWQTDNEYGCHDTIRSYSPEAARAFREWLEARYGDINALNTAWGNVFWSMEYRAFGEVDLPNLTTTEPNPSHVLDFYRFSSDQVVSFNRLQTDIIRPRAPGRDIIHNYMGFFFDFDHYKVARDLDAVGWDSYPIGFLDQGPFPPDDKRRFMRQGHPDTAAFHHDLYRPMAKGRWRVSEQQPGPVNWAPNNPAPLSGMARLWALEAFAHGAEVCAYFRWRQAPFAQEQMHAGLERPNRTTAQGGFEAREAARDAQNIALRPALRADVALLFDYETAWMFEAQPQGALWRYPAIVYQWYATLRRLGLDIDILPFDADLSAYKLVLTPSAPMADAAFVSRLAAAPGIKIIGPRSGSKTKHLSIPENLAPGPLQTLLPLVVTHVESLPDFYVVRGDFNGLAVEGRGWIDHVETSLKPLAAGPDGGLLYRAGRALYFTTLPSGPFLAAAVASLASEEKISLAPLHEDLRRRRCADLEFVFNYGPEPHDAPAPQDADFVIGGRTLSPAGVAAWRRKA
jgi:beta-galactosidase